MPLPSTTIYANGDFDSGEELSDDFEDIEEMNSDSFDDSDSETESMLKGVELVI